MKRRIKRAKIKFISLVPAGANRLPVLVKEDGHFEMTMVSKATEDLGEIHAVVYAPESRDSQDHIASAEVIKGMAYSFQQGGGQLDLRHDGKALDRDRAYVAETFIVQKGDPRFEGLKDRDGNSVVTDGAWGVVIKIEDDSLRKLYKEGKWSGVSLAGTAELEVEKEDDPSSFFQFMKSFFNGERKMTKELKKELEDLAKTVTGLVETVQKMADVKKEPELSDAEKELIELKAKLAKAEKPELSDVEKELVEVKAKLAKLEKASNQDPAPKDDDRAVIGVELTKEEIDLVSRAQKVAQIINKQKGL